MTDKLPTKSQIEKAAASDDEESLHSLLLQAFQYGTNYQQPEPPSKEQTGQASLLLVQVWTALPQIEATLVDVLWTLSSTITQEENLEALKVIISDLITQVPQRDTFYQQLQATLIDTELLQSLRLLDGDAFSKRIRKFNTEINFRQTKYNLMQEESQGYSKLLTLLYQNDMSASVTPERLNELMGAFELDPNRVLDLLLHVLEQRPDHQNFLLNLITQNFCVDKIPALLEFQLRSSTSIDSLYPTMILLAKRQLLDLKAVTDKSLQELHVCFGLFEKYLKLHIRQLGRISLAETGTQYSGDPKLDQAQKELHDATQKLRTQNILTGLLVALLQSGEWDLAKDLVSLLDWTKLCTLLPDLIGRHLTQQVSHSISRLYVAKVITPNVGISTPKSIENRANDDAATKKLLDSAAFDSLLEICRLPLMALGASGCLSRQPVLYVKICRLAKAFLLEESSADETSTAVYDLLRNVLIPSLSLIPEPNPALSADLWSLLSLVPYAKRYQIYSDWKGAGLERAAMMGVAAQKPLLQIQAEMEAGKAARYTLKRLSKDNVRDMGRQVSKVTHSNPLVVFTTILNQIESYDNLIQLMVEIVRFVTPLSLDVLSYCIQSRLSGQGAGGVNRNRLKDDGVNVSQWLQSLEAFVGAFYRRCPDVEFRGILSYLVHRLKDGKVLELGVLKTFIKTAGGYSFADYSPAASLSEQQLEGLAGSQLLKRETCAFGIVEDFNERASSRIKSVLQSHSLGVTLLILLAQTRSRLLFDGGGMRKKHVKLIANLLDTCQVVMYVLLEFLTYSRDPKESEEVSTSDSDAVELYASSLPSLGELFEAYRVDAVTAWMLCRPIYRELTSDKKVGQKIQYHQSEKNLIIQRMLPDDAWEDITTELFTTFFSFALYDIYFPESRYFAELSRLKDTDQRLTQKKKNHQPGILGMDFTREDEATWERVKLSATALEEDMEKQRKHCIDIQKKVAVSAQDLFPSKDIAIAPVQAFLTHCVYPRCRLSPADAIYCAQFVIFLHNNKTPGFSTMHFIDEFIDAFCGMLYSSTEDEAAAIGILLLEIWKVVSRWRYDTSAFESEVVGFPGSALIQDGGQRHVSRDDFTVLYNKWHAAIGRATLGALDSTEYMHVRASFVILSRIVDAFPTRPKLGQKLFDALVPFQEDTYPLQDIKTAAQAYGILLLNARSNGVWKEEDAAAVKAREDKKKADMAEKLKRREEQLAELNRDTAKINEEIGHEDRDGDRRRGPPPGDVKKPSFEPVANVQRDGHAAPVFGREGGNETSDGRRPRGVSDSDRGIAPRSDTRNDVTSRQQASQSSSLEGRWERGGAKRERSPTTGGEDQPAVKRPRTDARPNGPPLNFEPPPRVGQRSGSVPQGQQAPTRGGGERGSERTTERSGGERAPERLGERSGERGREGYTGRRGPQRR